MIQEAQSVIKWNFLTRESINESLQYEPPEIETAQFDISATAFENLSFLPGSIARVQVVPDHPDLSYFYILGVVPDSQQKENGPEILVKLLNTDDVLAFEKKMFQTNTSILNTRDYLLLKQFLPTHWAYTDPEQSNRAGSTLDELSCYYDYSKGFKDFHFLESSLVYFPQETNVIFMAMMKDKEQLKNSVEKFSHLYRLLVRLPKQAAELAAFFVTDSKWVQMAAAQLNASIAKEDNTLSFKFIQHMLIGLNFVMDPNAQSEVKVPLLEGLRILTATIAKSLENKPELANILHQFNIVYASWHKKLYLSPSIAQTCTGYAALPSSSSSSMPVNQAQIEKEMTGNTVVYRRPSI